jgi:hypothetical protein
MTVSKQKRNIYVWYGSLITIEIFVINFYVYLVCFLASSYLSATELLKRFVLHAAFFLFGLKCNNLISCIMCCFFPPLEYNINFAHYRFGSDEI